MRLQPTPGLVLVAAMVAACGPAAVASVPPPKATVEPTAVASPTPVPSTIKPEARISVAKPGWVVFDGNSLVVFSTNGTISRIDPATNRSSAPTTVDPAWNGGGFALNATGIWLGDFDTNVVDRIDPASFAVIATIPVPLNPEGAGVSADAVWIANHRGGTVTRIDPATNKIVATVKVSNVGSGGPHQFGFGLGSVWVSAGNSQTVVRIDPATNAIQATIPTPANASACGGFTFTRDAVWMPSCADSTILVRIDPSANKVVAAIELDGYGGDAALVINDMPWFVVASRTGSGAARLVRINPATNQIDRVLSLGETFTDGGLIVGAGSVWTTDWINDQVLRLPLAAFGE